MGVRRFAALVAGLPPGCATARHHDPERLGVGWRTEHELLAALIEVSDLGNRMFHAANSKEGARQPDPIVIPRPGGPVKPPPPKKASPSEIRAFMARSGRVIATPKD